MILLTHESRIQLGIQPADFRKGVDGFVSLCKNQLLLEPRDGSIFVFINRAGTMIRALSYDGTGYWLMTKRLSRGKFKHWPTGQGALSATSARELRQIINGEPWQQWDSSEPPSAIPPLHTEGISTMVKPRTVT
jgi:transposase